MENFDTIVIGAGLAGMSCAMELVMVNRGVLLLAGEWRCGER